jgi:RHS repeat-associated protein
VSDKKLGVDSDNNGVIDYYNADVVTANDYYPFGMQMPGRKFSSLSSKYRYGFNGKENDNEVKGEGNQQDYGNRIYDPRLGRFLSVDPLTKKFPNLTPYQYAGNKPIWCVDLDGLEDIPTTELNKYGEKQVYQISTDITDGNTISTFTSNQVPSNAKPVTQNLSDKQIYRLAVARMLVPGQFLIGKDQYLDEKYFEAEQRINYYYSHHATATMSKGSHSDKLTGEIHNLVTNALFSDDNTMSDAAATMIDRRTSFLGKFNWAKTAVEFGAGALIASGFKYAVGRLGGALESLGIPKGFGIMADPGKFRVASGTLNEQVAMKEAMTGGAGDRLTATHSTMAGGAPKVLTDPRLNGLNITKYEYNKKIFGSDGKTVVENINIHYLQNNTTGQRFDFKFTQ